MFKITNNEIRITRGDSAYFSVDLENEDGTPYTPVSGDHLTFTVKTSTVSPKSIIKIEEDASSPNFSLNPDDTSSLKYGEYVYDIQFTAENGFVDTVIEPSPFIVTEEVTW